MAKNVGNDIEYYLLIDVADKADLKDIRKWNNVKIAFDGNSIWAKNFDYAQINSLEVKTIPYKEVFYAKEGKLFLLNSFLPDRNIPSLLWTTIDRALPVQLPSFNHNYFGIDEKIQPRLIASSFEAEAVAMITTILDLKKYIETAAAIRLQKIKWAILNHNQVFLIGKPLLPIKGNVFWQRKKFLLPAGFDLDLFILEDELNDLINPDNESWVIWNLDNSYFLIERENVQPLTLSSFRLSVQQFSLQ